MKLSAKFKEILWSGFRATLNFQLFEVALNPLTRIFFLTLQKILFWHADYISEIKKWGPPNSFLRYEQLKPKYEVFLQGFPFLFFFSNNECLIWYHNIAVK